MWSKNEKSVARQAFDKAYERENKELVNNIKEMANTAKTSEDIWQLHDFLTEKRSEIDNKYNYRYSVLMFVFGRLVREGWVALDDLEGLSEDKIEKIKHIINM